MGKFHRVEIATLKVKPNNNSADGISPNYIYGCLGGCMSSYCYVARHNADEIFVTENVKDVHQAVSDWVEKLRWPKTPNQQDDKYYLIDIGCNTDIPLMQKYLKLDEILAFYDNHPKLKLTFATKYSKMLTTDVRHLTKKPRVRISLMPEELREILEPNTTNIRERIKDISRLKELGWEVHINFSPVVVTKNYIELYRELFKMLNKYVEYKHLVKAEVIFLTTHHNNFVVAQEKNPRAIPYMKPAREVKNETGVMRYPVANKRYYIELFEKLIEEEIPWCKIRYIF